MLVNVPTKGKPLLALIIVAFVLPIVSAIYNYAQGICISGPFGECNENYNVFIGILNGEASIFGWLIGGLLLAALFGLNKRNDLS